MKQNDQKAGILYTLVAYLIWGFLPIYWKLVDYISPDQILAHRIVWSFVLMIAILLLAKKGRKFVKEFKIIMKQRKRLIGITLASIIISLNWLTYIWAVNNDHVIQASLGYYINPLISVLLGVIVLKETLNNQQRIAVLIAALGVSILTFSYGVFPWVSLVLAITFALYGLAKKLVDVDEMFGLTIETMMVTPIALIYLFTLPEGTFSSYFNDISTLLLLMGTGAATAIPLLLFAYGARRMSLTLLGFLQYIAPTIMLFIGIFLYKETFTTIHLISFICIWIALIVYMSSNLRRHHRKDPVLEQKSS